MCQQARPRSGLLGKCYALKVRYRVGVKLQLKRTRLHGRRGEGRGLGGSNTQKWTQKAALAWLDLAEGGKRSALTEMILTLAPPPPSRPSFAPPPLSPFSYA